VALEHLQRRCASVSQVERTRNRWNRAYSQLGWSFRKVSRRILLETIFSSLSHPLPTITVDTNKPASPGGQEQTSLPEHPATDGLLSHPDYHTPVQRSRRTNTALSCCGWRIDITIAAHSDLSLLQAPHNWARVPARSLDPPIQVPSRSIGFSHIGVDLSFLVLPCRASGLRHCPTLSIQSQPHNRPMWLPNPQPLSSRPRSLVE
jgi:hypothetical protein